MVTKNIISTLTGPTTEAELESLGLKLPLTPEQHSKLPMRLRWALEQRETEWVPIPKTEWPAVPARPDPRLDRILCPRCELEGTWQPPKDRGVTTGAIRRHNRTACICVLRERFWNIFTNNVGSRYQERSLAELKPSEKSRLSIESQQKFYDQLRTKPDDSYAFFGPVGTSKTAMVCALYRHQLSTYLANIWKEHCDRDSCIDIRTRFVRRTNASELPVWRIEAKKLLLQHHDFAINRPVTNEAGEEMGGAPEPAVTTRRIKKFAHGHKKVHLFLEEIDKVELTKARRDILFEIVNAVYEEEGQLVINTNLTKEEFADVYGAEFVRRIKEMCTVKDLYDKEQ
jgi:hypothetical protein